MKDATFCVQCGLRLAEFVAKSDANATTEPPAPTSSAKGWDSFGLFRRFRRSPKVEVTSSQPQQSHHQVRPVFFYGILTLVVMGILGAVVLPIAAGQAPRGQDIAGAAFWTAICTYLVSRRRNKSKPNSWLYATLVAIAVVPLTGLLDGIVNRDRYAFNRELSKNPAMSAIKDFDPKTYDAYVKKILTISREATDSAASTKMIASETSILFRRYLRTTTDAALINLYRANLRRMNSARTSDPERCYRYGLGQYAQGSFASAPAEDKRESLEALADVIRSAINQPEKTVPQETIQPLINRAFATAAIRLGPEADLLDLIDNPKGNFAGACKGMITLLQSVFELPPSESASLLRSFVSQ